ncbi:MAG: hypothetical protein Q4G24_05020 [Paracoccus sp. (in: a-proteobacteria)]|uniref:NfeD family protein n=1 Tax=Paracoccus sp. TaxID=267 RepID=UPI0026DFCE96|nr:hypothetical protein [Paracoccus sp. (in: a-proteobacteria)]MDO5620813.1 hypothetical protein [Paracoccus sp. (in: a-proteobacteria)]
MIWTNGWLWIIAGLVLAGLELILPGYVFIGAAIAVAMVGLLLLLGLWPWSLPAALVLVAVLTALVWWWLRRSMGVQKGQVRIWDRDIND